METKKLYETMIGKCMINKYSKNKSRPRDFTRLSEINKNEVNILNFKLQL
jgi:hypothetical protein